MPPMRCLQSRIVEVDKENAKGKPSRAIACTNVKGGLAYMCEWNNGARKILTATAVAPDVVIPFLESFVVISNANHIANITGLQGILLIP